MNFAIKLLFNVSFLFISFFCRSIDANNEDNTNTKPYFRNGEAQRVKGFAERKEWIKEELWVETSFDSDSDGKSDRMHVFVTRPYQTETQNLQLPVIYVSSPYFSGLAKNRKKNHWDPKVELGIIPPNHKHPSVRQKKSRNLSMFFYDIQWVPRGYIMVYSSSPGTGLSDGAPTIGGKNETLAPKAVIDWLCGRAKGFNSRLGNVEVFAKWSTGKVGMIGASYNGTLALAAATTGVQGLEAIIPIAPVTSWYNYYRSNGLVRSPGGYIGEDTDVLYDGVHSGDKSKRVLNNQKVRDSVLVSGQDRLSGDYNSFWDSRNYLKQMGDMKAAMFMVHSVNDWNVMFEHSVSAFQKTQELGIISRFYIGIGSHGASPPFSLMNLWFTRYLHGVENNIEDKAPVLIMRANYSKAKGYSSFPDKNMEMVKFYLGIGGNVSGELKTSKNDKREFESFEDDHEYNAEELAVSKLTNNRLLYLSKKLTNKVRFSGSPIVHLSLKINKSAANLSVYLIALSVGDKGELNCSSITRGWADPQNYTIPEKAGYCNLSNSSPVDTTHFYNIKFKLNPTDRIINSGKRVGVMIFSSDQNFTLHPKAGTVLSIDLSKSSIDLPIVGGETSFK